MIKFREASRLFRRLNAMKNVIVVGAGAAGLMAAYAAAKNGNAVTVLERNEKAGKKIYITGKGRCNVTNNVPPEEFFENVIRNAKFLKKSIYSFSPERLMKLLEEGGLPLKTERGNRVFPASEHASDVTKCLQRYCSEAGVRFAFNERVESIEKTPDAGFRVRTEKGNYSADAVIICTGGLSYPSTGSTGDGYTFAKKFGLKIVPCRASLCGIECDMRMLSQLQGLSLRNVRISAYRQSRLVASHFGEMLFTHYGISGPIVLSLSAAINDLPVKELNLQIDLKPALETEILDKRLLRDFEKFKNKQMQNALVELLPKNLIVPVLRLANIPSDLMANSLTKQQRKSLCAAVKNFALRPTSLRPISEAVVTAGGVDVAQLDPKTMECKSVPGLYLCGEVLDVDALTGGFNLHIAFATGYAAGSSIS